MVTRRPTQTSKRTWSLPLPVAPWHTASAPTSLAISIWRLAISGLRRGGTGRQGQQPARGGLRGGRGEQVSCSAACLWCASYASLLRTT